ncbi:MAG: hypothetical protein ACI82F_002645 [Planctomycetota bacterium]|jgi:hypothetical protein
MRTLPLLAFLLGTSACSTHIEGEQQPATEGSQSSTLIDEAFVPRLLEIAAAYKPVGAQADHEAFLGTRHNGWAKLGDVPSWAPELCGMPPAPGPLVSESGDEGTHGRKLYFLYTRA